MNNVANFVFLQIGWFACAFGVGERLPTISLAILVTLLAIHIYFSKRRLQDSFFISIVGLLGGIIDSLQSYFGVLHFYPEHSPAWLSPLWLVALWMLFASTFHYSLVWLNQRYLLAALLGAIGGPLSYYGGTKFNVLTLSEPFYSLLTISIIWALLTPSLLWLSKLPSFATIEDTSEPIQ